MREHVFAETVCERALDKAKKVFCDFLTSVFALKY